MNNNFINHTDPTLPIDFGSVTLESQYTKLTEREKLIVASKCLGMNHVPVDIQTFLDDPYYLGAPEITNGGKAIFDYWRDKLSAIFPSPLTTSTCYISFGGCIGSGKSFMSKVMGLYHYHRLDCCTNVFASLGLAGQTKIAFSFFHASYDTAEKDFIRFYKGVFEVSPYFKNLYNKPPIRLIASGPRSGSSIIGTQLIYCVLSEIGFWRPQDAIDKINEVLIRYQSRFATKRHNFGSVICDSSAHDAEMGASQLFESSVPERELFCISPNHWSVRPNLYKESQGRTFKVYKGDSKVMPRIIEEGDDLEGLDLDRMIEVPIQLKFNFINDITRSLNDLAGIPYTNKSLLFAGDISHLLKCAGIPNIIKDVIDDIDFFDLSDTIYDRCLPMLLRIPKLTSIFVHLDIGLRTDLCGLSICYYTGETTNTDGVGLDTASYPTFKVPLVVGIGRKKGQSTSLDHLFQFIQRLSLDYSVHVSADSFASAGLFQSCERAGIPYSAVSVDKTTDAYFMFKNVVNTERLELPYNERLLRECSELRIVTNGKNMDHVKVDHPDVSGCYEFDYKLRKKDEALPGTKDLADAVVGSLWSCYQKYSEHMEEGAGMTKQMKIIEDMTRSAADDANNAIQGMIESIF